MWRRVDKFHRAANELADRHYSRRKPGSGQFMPPGQTVVLWQPGAVFGWWRPHPDSGLKLWSGLDGWTCTIFRNETGGGVASAMIRDAEQFLDGYSCGPDGLMTYVDLRHVITEVPGYCFRRAGYRRQGMSADGHKLLLAKRWPFGPPRQMEMFS